MPTCDRSRWAGLARGLLLAAALTLLPGPSLGQTRLDLRDADLRAFIEIVAEATGTNFALDPRVAGTVTVVAPEPLSEDALYEVFLSVLELNRLTIVAGDQVTRIVPIDRAREIPPAETSTGGFETRIFQLDVLPAAQAVEVLRPLLAQEAVIIPLFASRQLIVSDRSANLERVQRLLDDLESATGPSRIETILLRNGDATGLAQSIQALDIVPPGASVSADARSNAIIVSGDDAFRDRIRQLVPELDRPRSTQTTTIIALRYADATALGQVIQQSFSVQGEGAAGIDLVSVTADPRSNSLIINAPAGRRDEISAAVRQLDQRPLQVLVEAVIFELSVNSFSDLSAQFGGLLNDALIGGAEFSVGNRPTLTSLVSAAVAGNAAGPGRGGTIGYTNEERTFLAFLTALTRESSTRLLSTPSLLTLNNAEAEIIVAQNVPFVTGSFSTVGESAVPTTPFQTVQREDVGLTLRVTPQISAGNVVRMEVLQEVSNLTASTATSGGEITAKRSLKTNVMVRDGNVIMLGGLLENGSGSSEERVPGLSRIPMIGGLFRGRSASGQQRVLLMMLRPRVITSDQQAEAATQGVARTAAEASRAIRPQNDGRFPQVPATSLPFGGVDLDQPFSLVISDPVARQMAFPPLPAPLTFADE